MYKRQLGDFVLTGGEGAALVISDAVIRRLDHGIKEESHSDDSFENGLLEYPQYTLSLIHISAVYKKGNPALC